MMNRFPQRSPSRARSRGTALIFSMFFVLLVGLLISAVLPRTSFHHSTAFRETHYIAALQLAEGGLEEGIWQLSYGRSGGWDGWDTTRPAVYYLPRRPFYDADGRELGEVEVRVDNPIPLGITVNLGSSANPWPMPITASASPTITALAGVPNLETPGSDLRLVEIVARSRTVFSLGLFSDQTLDLGGTTVVNSYDSRLGPYDPVTNAFANGDAGSNHDIVLGGTVLVDGDAAAGGTILYNDNSSITGEVEGGISRIDLPSADDPVNAGKAANNNAEIPLAAKDNGTFVDVFNDSTNELRVAANSTLTLPGGTKEQPKIYYFSSASMLGGSTIVTTGYVVIVSDGTLDFSGGTIANNGGSGSPEQLIIYNNGDLSDHVKVNGGAGFAGAVYAPNASVDFSGGGQVFGAFVGGQITVVGNAQFHYDEALGDHGLVAFFELNEWVEKAPPMPSSHALLAPAQVSSSL